jgi:hypothetical protein
MLAVQIEFTIKGIRRVSWVQGVGEKSSVYDEILIDIWKRFLQSDLLELEVAIQDTANELLKEKETEKNEKDIANQ